MSTTRKQTSTMKLLTISEMLRDCKDDDIEQQSSSSTPESMLPSWQRAWGA
jgi:hypothetical protein